ncbi:MAG TPA: type II toxin-antitoxin system PemK/MazF family toxin [Ilumatobacteraceae bacterium]|jgi:mRNA-degrading endonuclease toxin of MazEF toxin-antitoxin module|nr:type II toxin-antitoxin system PemK/MazF family toxin [Ilumatobacteraceae bacterium]
MIHAGDIHLADLRDERRWVVLVLSNDRFHRMSERVLVAPAIEVDGDEVLAPWNIIVEGDVFALDLLRSIPAARLLKRTGRASSLDLERARRALRLIT